MDPVLTVNNLTKIFTRQGHADLTAVDHVSFTLHKGECLGIIGESGSGKSTVAGIRRGHHQGKRQSAPQRLPQNADGVPDAGGVF